MAGTSGLPTRPGALPPASPHFLVLAPRAMSGGRKTLKGLLGWVCGWTWASGGRMGMKVCGPHALCPRDRHCHLWSVKAGLAKGIGD